MERERIYIERENIYVYRERKRALRSLDTFNSYKNPTM